ncbi:hypothetical protein BJ742DRAFT_795324 [Cladochytrium replicatum]|nr:hypothetical protein BJ742DRAFT_795324 [Cladochytrium replicatum]
MHALKQNLESEAWTSQTLVIWTDCDLEGENIGEGVAVVCQQSNPRLKVKHPRFTVVQPREIKHAWESLVMLDLFQAAALRQARTRFTYRGRIYAIPDPLCSSEHQRTSEKIVSYGECA